MSQATLPGFSAPEAPTTTADAHPLAAFSPLFREAENARTAAWRALEAENWNEAARQCEAAASAFAAAAREARRNA